MRDIKFRGMGEQGVWHYGFYFQAMSGNHFIVYTERNDKGVFVRNVQVEPETVGQFTGLVDSNNQPIYEGDILDMYLPRNEDDYSHTGRKIKAEITFDSGAFWFSGDNYTDCNWHFYNASDRTVISNIHEQEAAAK